jgi:sigma-B regulation protein RsbU (phosphoserine phosphatase)
MSMPTIYIYPKQGDPASVVLKNAPMTLGRLAENDIPLPDPFCSGRHAVIYPDEAGGFAIRDNGSKNGTFVNGKRLTGPVGLKEGDEILIGSVRVVFNKAIQTNVEVTDAPDPTTNVNTVIPFRDILARPSVRTTIQASIPVSEVEEIRAENKMFAVLSEVSRALVLHKPLAELLDHVMDLISAHLSMDRGVLMLREGNPVQLIPKVVRINSKHLQGQKIQVSRSIMAMAFDEQLAVLTSDAALDPRFKGRESIINSGIHSAMCVPLWNNREIIGIIYADRISLLQEFSEEDLRLLTLLANLAAVKIENAMLIEQSIEKERMERELQLAVQIQKDFLPKTVPKSGPFDIVGRNISCRQVGGDYYDFIPIESCRLGVTVADVSGKGVSASLLMASLRAALHSEVNPRYKTAEMAAKLNDFVQRSSAIDTFITFFYGELDVESGAFAFVNAGHNHPFILDTGGKARFLESTGLPLGMLPGQAYEERSSTVAPGETLVLFTDGIVESRNPSEEEYGVSRLVNVCRRSAEAPAADIMDAVFRDLDEFTGQAPAADDRTLVVVRRGL